MEPFSKLDIAPFQALMNMIKFTYLEKQEVFRTLLAILSDYDPLDIKMTEKCVHYIQLLLDENTDLAGLLLTFFPSAPVKDDPLSRNEICKSQGNKERGIITSGPREYGDCSVPPHTFMGPPPEITSQYIAPCYFTVPSRFIGPQPVSVRNGPQSHTATTNVISWAAPFGPFRMVGSYQPCAFPPQLLPSGSAPPPIQYPKLPQPSDRQPMLTNFVPSVSKFHRSKVKRDKDTILHKNTQRILDVTKSSDAYQEHGSVKTNFQMSDDLVGNFKSEHSSPDLDIPVTKVLSRKSNEWGMKVKNECISNESADISNKGNFQMSEHLSSNFKSEEHSSASLSVDSPVTTEQTKKSVWRMKVRKECTSKSNRSADVSNTSNFQVSENLANNLKPEPSLSRATDADIIGELSRKSNFWRMNVKKSGKPTDSLHAGASIFPIESTNVRRGVADNTNLAAFPYMQQVILPDGIMQNLIFEGSSVHIQAKSNSGARHFTELEKVRKPKKGITIQPHSDKKFGRKYGSKSLASLVASKREQSEKNWGGILPRPCQNIMSPKKVMVKNKSTVRVFTDMLDDTKSDSNSHKSVGTNKVQLAGKSMPHIRLSLKYSMDNVDVSENSKHKLQKDTNDELPKNLVKKFRVCNKSSNSVNTDIMDMSEAHVHSEEINCCPGSVCKNPDISQAVVNEMCLFEDSPKVVKTSKVKIKSGSSEESKIYNLRTPTKATKK